MRIYFSGNANGVFNAEFLAAPRGPHIMLTFHDLHKSKQGSPARKRLIGCLKSVTKKNKP